MKKKIRVGVIGVGSMGNNHARILSQLADLVAVSDTSKATGNIIAKKYSTKYYIDFRELLNAERPDCVTIAVPTEFHFPVAAYCLERKISTLVEKPITKTVKEGKQLIKIARSNRTVLMVGHTERFNPAVIKLKQIISKGQLGSLINLLALRVGLHPPLTKDMDVALDLGIHDIDIISYLIGEYPLKKLVNKNRWIKESRADSASYILQYSHATGIVHTN